MVGPPKLSLVGLSFMHTENTLIHGNPMGTTCGLTLSINCIETRQLTFSSATTTNRKQNRSSDKKTKIEEQQMSSLPCSVRVCPNWQYQEFRPWVRGTLAWFSHHRHHFLPAFLRPRSSEVGMLSFVVDKGLVFSRQSPAHLGPTWLVGIGLLQHFLPLIVMQVPPRHPSPPLRSWKVASLWRFTGRTL